MTSSLPKSIKGDLSSLDVVSYLRELGLKPTQDKSNAEKWHIDCPWMHEHTKEDGPKDSTVFWDGTGKPQFSCFHGHCADRGMYDVYEFAESHRKGITDEFCRAEFMPDGTRRQYAHASNRRDSGQVKPKHHDGSRAPLPDDLAETNPIEFLKGLFELDDIVCIAWEDHDGRPSKVDARRLYEWEAIYEALPENFSAPNGVWFCINPLTKTGTGAGIRTNENVAQFRRTLIESDPPKNATEADKQRIKEEACSWLLSSGLPVARIYDSAGKSIHGLVAVGAKDQRDFDERVAKIYAYAAGFPGLDPGRTASAQLSRLPGAYRNGVKQTLRYLSVGPKSYEEWEAKQPKEEVQPKAEALKGDQEDEPEVTQELLDRTYRDTDQEDYPAPLAKAAFCGPLGKLVDAIAPNTEASREALLLQAIVAFGNILGRTAWINAGSKHFGSEFVVIAGDTSKGRKGTGLAMIREAFGNLDSSWATNCQLSGIQSGEGIINSVRDEKYGPSKKKDSAGELVLLESGIQDKRKLIVEEEFAQILAVSGRKDNTTSNILRSAWDCPNFLENSAKREGQRATKPHISLIAHTTREEFRAKSEGTTDAVNGTFNRFLFCASRRSQVLPEPRWIDWSEDNGPALLKPLLDAIERFSGDETQIKRDQEARRRWDRYYRELEGLTGNGGMLDKVIGRLHAHAARLSVIFAAADNSETIRIEHQEAAEAVIDYCARSAKWIFGVLTGDKMADRVIQFLRRHPEGASKSAIMTKVFYGNTPAAEVDRILAKVRASGFGDFRIEKTSSKSVEKWFSK